MLDWPNSSHRGWCAVSSDYTCQLNVGTKDSRLPGKRRLAGNTSDILFLAACSPLKLHSVIHGFADCYISLDRVDLSPSMMLSALVALLLSIIYVQAFTITQPDSTGWPRNSGFMTVRWTTDSSDPPIFTILLRDASESSVVNPLAVAANVPSSSGSFELDLPTVPLSPTYQLLFVDPTNLTRILTTSPIFPITNSPTTISSETITQQTVTVTLSLSPSASSIIPPTISLVSSSTIPPTNSGTPSATSASSTPTSITRFTTSTLGTTPPGTVTVTVTPDPESSFVPINSAERPWRMDGWIGPLVVVTISFYLGGL
ncbi:unnamed protein product [Rhizoctonia solani]|uniref:Yeast cell wall synthesis Kre9/Knh1-like N-terminal domain-containing protein n=1 Tax=Rhizoctonia solani TaxID=456999 RepID=A0A8H3BFL2_9AGAM|nr:unnamed protein product [Rhizoctonia solani]